MTISARARWRRTASANEMSCAASEGGDRLSLRRDPEGLLPAAGHRAHHRHPMSRRTRQRSSMRPRLLHRGDRRSVDLLRSTSNAKKPYPVPKRDRTVESKRRDADVGKIFRDQFERGIFETNLISIVSRVEAFIQECMFIAITNQPQKLSIIGDRTGIPLDLFIAHSDRNGLLESYIALRCQDLMFGKPSEYLDKAAKILSIEIEDEILENYIELKHLVTW
jgi:hypothetical protein